MGASRFLGRRPEIGNLEPTKRLSSHKKHPHLPLNQHKISNIVKIDQILLASQSGVAFSRCKYHPNNQQFFTACVHISNHSFRS